MKKRGSGERIFSRMRVKFLLIIMLCLTLLLGVVFGSLYAGMRLRSISRSYERMLQVTESDGVLLLQREGWFHPAGGQTEEDSYLNMTMYSVKLNQKGEAVEIIAPYETTLSTEEMGEFAAEVMSFGRTRGVQEGQLYLITPKSYGYMIVFCDGRYEDGMMRMLLELSLLVGAAAWVVLFGLAWLLSRVTVKPVEQAFMKQRRFVSDASHELKTPLAVIHTNADVLRSEIGENRWLDYIQSETGRMSSLVNDLLDLTRLDEERGLEMQKFSLSAAVTGSVLPFESVAFEKGKTLRWEIAPDLYTVGDEKKIRQLAVILIDNAVKHSAEGGLVEVELKQQENRLRLSVSNTGEPIPEKDVPHLFERFYRCDDSRARSTGGFGLGLAIAKSITDAHRGKITVSSSAKTGITEFSVLLSASE